MTAMIGIGTHKDNLLAQADLHYEDIVNTRVWNAKLGGVYAYLGLHKPNPYLKNPTIKDSNNKTMIKINPAWMTRMLSENSTSNNYRFYLKSNNPINPINKAKGFYAKSLNEISKTDNFNDKIRYRLIEKTKKIEYIKGIYLKESCISCHKSEKYKIGSLRGGIVVEINAISYFNRVDAIWKEFFSISTIVTALFILLIVVVRKFIFRSLEVELLNSSLESMVNEKTHYLNTLFEHNPNIIIVTNGGKILKTNQAFFNFFEEYDNLEAFLVEYDCICQLFENGDDKNLIINIKNKWLFDVFSKEQPIAKITQNSKTHYFSVLAKKIYEEDSMHYMVTFNDITETYNLKKEYEKLSITDALTGLYNRRHFNQIFASEIHRALRGKYSFTFLIIDIDYFKLYNDNYGHDKGDILLQDISQHLKRSLKRSNEFLFRIGGEEFGVIYSDLSKEDSISHAKDICTSVESMNIEHKYSLCHNSLTISIGHFYTDSDKLLKVKTIYHNTDKALYYAKEHGRNRVSDYDEIGDGN